MSIHLFHLPGYESLLLGKCTNTFFLLLLYEIFEHGASVFSDKVKIRNSLFTGPLKGFREVGIAGCHLYLCNISLSNLVLLFYNTKTEYKFDSNYLE